MSYDNFMTCITTCLTTMFVNRAPGFWITLKFLLPLLSMGHKGNRCKTEDGAAT